MIRASRTSSTLNGLFKDVYAKKIADLVPATNLFNIDKSTYSIWQGGNFSGVVHPLTYERLQNAVNKLKETEPMGTYDQCEGKATEESQVAIALNYHKNQVRELRASIARKQEQLRIALALLAAVKKLDKGDK